MLDKLPTLYGAHGAIPHPCEQEALLNITLVSSASQRNYAFAVLGHRVLALMATDIWPEGIDNAVIAQIYGLIGALRTITSSERKKLKDQMEADNKHIVNVFTTFENVAMLLQNFSEDAHSVDDHVPGWLLDRLDTLTTNMGVKLVPRLVAKDYQKIARLYSFATRIASDVPRRDPLSEHVLPTHYATGDQRLTDPVTFHYFAKLRQQRRENYRARRREAETARAATETGVAQ